jgi:hypothetical protein
LSRDKDIFFEKKKIKLFDTANSRIYVLECMGVMLQREIFIFEKNKILENKILLKKKIISKKIIFIFHKKNPPS